MSNSRTAERVVRLLAEQEAPLLDGTYANGHDWCSLCGGEGPRPQDHDADCPWRLAREHVESIRAALASEPKGVQVQACRSSCSMNPWSIRKSK